MQDSQRISGAVVDVNEVEGTSTAIGIFASALVKGEEVSKDAIAVALLPLDDPTLSTKDKRKIYQKNAGAIVQRLQEVMRENSTIEELLRPH
jgi:hypothetical protein